MLRLRRTLHKQRPRSAWLLLVAFLRVLTLLFAMQFSGLIHGVSDFVGAVAAEGGHEHEQCPPDRPCEDCPPGCPNCHCGVLGSVLPESPLALLLSLPTDSRPSRVDARDAPAGPELPSLFRPPRV